MAKYTEEFRSQAVHWYNTLLREGTVQVDSDLYLNNVRELVAFLEISSYSLYKWVEKLGGEDIINIVDNLVNIDTDFFSKDPHDYPKESYDNFGLDTVFDTDKIIMELDNTWFMTLARALKIKNYRMPIKQLYLKIGSELIKRSGLVENGVVEGLRLE